MAITYACSMDHYGAGDGTNQHSTQPYTWSMPQDNMLGDLWSATPVMVTTSSGFWWPTGALKLQKPSWGARGGDRALIADSFAIENNPSYPTISDTYTLTGTECARLLIPGASSSRQLIHFAFSLSDLPSTDLTQGMICHFTTGAGLVAFTLSVTPSGRLQLQSFGTSTLNQDETISTDVVAHVTSSSPVIQPKTWYYLSIDITTTSGTPDTHDVKVYMNGSGAGDIVLSDAALPASNNGNIEILGFLPASLQSYKAGVSQDQTQRCIRDIVILDTSGSYNTSVLGNAFVAAQEFRTEAAGGGWTPQSRVYLSQGILDAVTNQTGLYVPADPGFAIGSGDFTIESMVRFNDLPTSGSSVDVADIMGLWRTDNNERSYRLYYAGVDNTLRFDISTDGTTVTTIKTQPWSPDLDTWHHVAVSRSSGVTHMFVDGVELGVGVADTNTYFATSAANLGIAGQFDGTNSAASANTGLVGWLDETRLTIGTGRYTTDFTAPTAMFARDSIGDPNFANVVLLMGYDSGSTIVDESTHAYAVRPSSPDQTSILPNDAANPYDVLNQRPPWDDTYLEAPNTYAQGTLTLTGLPAASNTVTIGATTYTWVTTLASANDVLIGATTADCISNLIAAVNAGAGAGTVYGTGTTANADAIAFLYQDPQMGLRAKTLGTAGNSVATTTTGANLAFKSATLTGGTDIPADSDFAIEKLPASVTGVLGVQVTARAYKTESGTASMEFDLIGPSAGVAAGTAFNPSMSAAWNRQVFEQDPDTAAQITPSTVIGGKIRLKRVS